MDSARIAHLSLEDKKMAKNATKTSVTIDNLSKKMEHVKHAQIIHSSTLKRGPVQLANVMRYQF